MAILCAPDLPHESPRCPAGQPDQENIVAFAREFDPQPFDTDEAAAARSIYGGLLASGWHTGSLAMRILYDGLLKDTVSLGSAGIDELR